MSLGRSCGCPLCIIENQLLAEVSCAHDCTIQEWFSAFPSLRQYSSAQGLLSYLRTTTADARSDEIFMELFKLRWVHNEFAENILILMFLPVLHQTVRLVSKQQQALAEDDIAQQSLSCLVELLHSPQMQKRTSHFAFAISRGVRRNGT